MLGNYNSRYEVKAMKRLVMQIGYAAFVALSLLGGMALGQEDPVALSVLAAPAQTKSNNVRRAIEWKQFEYTCEGGTKLTVNLHNQTARVGYQGKAYSMKQTQSADGERYSDGKVVWWGRGNGGFLQEDAPDGNGRMIAKGCELDKPVNAQAGAGTVTGTVSYLQRMALPPGAVIEVLLDDVTLEDAPAKVIAEEKITLGERQVPVAFELKYDPGKIEAKHRYVVNARILVNGELRFINDQAYPVLTAGKAPQVEMILKQVASAGPK
jgi:putative lipoprotein